MSNDGRNPFGECEYGHQYFRGGCPGCGADMMLFVQEKGACGGLDAD